MLKRFKALDFFTRNVILVFTGSSIANFLNLIFQLFIAHNLSAADFAAFNSLLSVFLLFSMPLGTLQYTIAKYSSAFKAKDESDKTKFIIQTFLKKTLILAGLSLVIFWPFSFWILDKLKINYPLCGPIFAMLLAFCWVWPVLLGSVQGLELFKIYVAILISSGLVKLSLAFIFIFLGYKVTGALGAYLAANLFALVIVLPALKSVFFSKLAASKVDFKEMLFYLLPVALTNFLYIWLVSFDMVLVRYFFSPEESGSYALAQLLGKIFLFLPTAISVTMFPRISSLDAIRADTRGVLKRSLFYGLVLCALASLFYNLFPGLVIKLLTGKVSSQAILLGRFFSVSMTFFALLYIMVNYFLSLKDLRFLKYLASFGCLQFLAILLFHSSLYQVQAILCINSIALFVIHLMLISKRGTVPAPLNFI